VTYADQKVSEWKRKTQRIDIFQMHFMQFSFSAEDVQAALSDIKEYFEGEEKYTKHI